MADKVCEWCKKPYQGRKDSRYCKEQHYKTCDNPECDNEFAIKEMKRPAKTCSKPCADVLTKIGSTKEKVCQWHNCGKTFTSSKHDAMYCADKHYDDCVVCGNRFEMYNLHKPAKTCSKECAWKTVDDVSAVVKKRKATNQLKYGVDNPSQAQEVKDKKKVTTFKNHGVYNIFLAPEVQLKAAKNNGHRISKINQKWREKLLLSTGLEFEYESIIAPGKFADLGYQNLLIDINPTISHNSTFSYPHKLGYCKKDPCEKHYPLDDLRHQKRALAAEENGKMLLQYFDWYDPEIFISIIKAKLKQDVNKVYARKTILKEISQAEANRLFRENHLMGASNGQKLCLGLFYNDELIHVQTYGPARMTKKAEWEAIRSCSKIGYHVPGGFSKCDKYFFNKIDPESVVSYVDLSISYGHTDSMFDGWELKSLNKPSATWVRIVEDEMAEKENRKPLPRFVKDSTARRVSADRLLGFEVGDKYPRFDENGLKITNDYVFLSEGYVKMFDAGTRTYIWQRTS